MSKPSKRHTANSKLIDRTKLYSLEDAIKVLTSASKTKFDETVDVAIHLGVNSDKADQQVRGTMVLPHGSGKSKKLLVITKGENINLALQSGADYAGFEDMIEKIQGGWMEFEIVVATPDVMREVGKLGKTLGTKGLMPNPKAGTVTQNLLQTIKEIKAGRVEYRVQKEGLVNFGLGKLSFGDAKLIENARFAIETIVKAKPSGAKGTYMKSVAISSTMGPGMKLDLTQFSTKS